MKVDKKLHALACYSIYVTIFFFVIEHTSYLVASISAFSATFMIGLGKEIGDKYLWAGNAEFEDMVYNFLGITAGTLVAFLHSRLPMLLS